MKKTNVYDATRKERTGLIKKEKELEKLQRSDILQLNCQKSEDYK
jgi:hypothetical protein